MRKKPPDVGIPPGDAAVYLKQDIIQPARSYSVVLKSGGSTGAAADPDVIISK